MIATSLQDRLAKTLWCFLTVHFGRLLIVSGRIVLPVILSACLFTTQAMAADAIDREQAIEIAKQQNGGNGKVLGVETTTDSAGNTQYAVKLLSNGRVRVFTIKGAP